VLDLAAEQVQALAGLHARGLRLTVMIQDGEVSLLGEDGREAVLRPMPRTDPRAN